MVLLAAVTTTCVPPKEKPVRAIQAAFVTVDDESDWAWLRGNAPVSEIVIHNIFGYGDGCPTGCDKTDAAVQLIRDVDPNLKIHVGLVYEEHFHPHKATEKQLAAAAYEDASVARKFLHRLQKERLAHRISGWYLGREIYNFADTTKDAQVQTYLRVASCALPPVGDISIAPYFGPVCKDSETRDAKATATMFANLVRDTKVTRVLLQDGFGARNDRACKFDDINRYQAVAREYEREVKDALPPNVAFWIDLEYFVKDNTGDAPEKIRQCRLDWQYATVPKGTPIITFGYKGGGP